jgi:hypothetical protein
VKSTYAFIDLLEVIYITIAPIFLYGWLRGLLIGSALTSLMHIIRLLKKIEKNQRGRE